MVFAELPMVDGTSIHDSKGTLADDADHHFVSFFEAISFVHFCHISFHFLKLFRSYIFVTI